VDWGNPTPGGVRMLTERGMTDVVDPATYDPRGYAAPQLVSFRGEEALAEALVRAASGDETLVLLSTGHGEASVDDEQSGGLSRMARDLRSHRHRVGEWNPADARSVPPGCGVLLVVAPDQRFSTAEVQAVQEFVEGGGGLLVAVGEAPPGEEPFGAELLAGLGLACQPGLVCEALLGRGGESIQGNPLCALLSLTEGQMNASHPITSVLLAEGRRVHVVRGQPLLRGEVPTGALVVDLFSSGPRAWLDQVSADGTHDWTQAVGREERGRFRLGMAVTRTLAGADGETRSIALGSPGMLSNGLHGLNRRFINSAVAWLSDRDPRLGIPDRNDSGARMDLERGSARAALSWIFLLVLPGLALALAVLNAWRRSR